MHAPVSWLVVRDRDGWHMTIPDYQYKPAGSYRLVATFRTRAAAEAFRKEQDKFHSSHLT